jgi:hypothetical protein
MKLFFSLSVAVAQKLGQTGGLYYKHITIVNDDSSVTLQNVASLMSVTDNLS